MAADFAIPDDVLERLAALLKQRNAIDRGIAGILDRPALSGHFGEFVASRVFDIELHDSAVRKDSDGRFASGPHAGKTVQVKFYAKREGVLDMSTDVQPHFYIVLTGPWTPAVSSRGTTRPWVIEAAYLFDGPSLVSRLAGKVKIGVATSVRNAFWDEAEIYPRNNPAFPLSPAQRDMLALFRAGQAESAP